MILKKLSKVLKTCVTNTLYIGVILSSLLASVNVSAKSVSVITWNTFLLDTPDPLGINLGPQCEGNDCRQRAREVVYKVNAENIDIVNLQEVWEDVAISELNSVFSTYGYNYRVWNKNSGLYTASKYPILSSYFEEYIWDHGFIFDGGDVHKDKGFLAMDIAIPNSQTLKVINTHLDAGSDCEDKSVRLLQAYQLRDYLNGVTSSMPKLIGGDFNINAKSNGALGPCSNNERDAMVSDYGFNPADESKSQFVLLKQILNISAVHQLLGKSLSNTTVSGSGAIDYFLTKHHSGKVTYQNIQVLDQIWQRNYCYNIPILDGGIISEEGRTECFNHILSDNELDQIMPYGSAFITRISDQIREAQSDHFPVRLDMNVQ